MPLHLYPSHVSHRVKVTLWSTLLDPRNMQFSQIYHATELKVHFVLVIKNINISVVKITLNPLLCEQCKTC